MARKREIIANAAHVGRSKQLNQGVLAMVKSQTLLIGLSLFLSVITSGLVTASNANAAAFVRGEVEVRDAEGKIDRRIYTEISRGAKEAPVVVLLNGLIYDITRWAPVAKRLAAHNLTVVRMSFSPQPESLLLMEANESPAFVRRGLELSVLADDVSKVLNYHRISKPVTLVGLSYGGTVATEFAKLHPSKVKNLVLLSPLVVPLDTYQAASAPLRSMLDGVRFWEDASCAAYGWVNPYLCTAKDFWYDSVYNYFYENYLNVRVAKTPEGIEPALYKKAVFQLVRATRSYDLKEDIAKVKNIHLVIAGEEEPNLKADQLKVWALAPKRAKRSLAEFTGVKHALPDEAPLNTANWIEDIANGDASLQSGDEFIVEGK